ncbi:MAG TPA: phosphatase PAP2 family protein [Mucilaginibacter sp.]|nr:phosphatase PAP2 family protein [Mucilaginibacter sp.]
MRFTRYYITIILLLICGSRPFAQNLDVDILKAINTEHPDSKYWQYISNSIYYLPATISVGQFSYGVFQGSGLIRNRSYETLISIGISGIIGEVLKYTIKEVRPSVRYPGVIFTNSDTKDPSFPSGHTLVAFATATSLALEYKKWYVTGPAFLWAGSVAYSRMYLGKHYPSDVLAGTALGILSGIISHKFSINVLKSYNMK